MSGGDIPSPLTPQIRSHKTTHSMTRRASTIKGLAFSIEDFELGPQVGSGFFGKVRKVRHKYSELIGVEVLQFHN